MKRVVIAAAIVAFAFAPGTVTAQSSGSGCFTGFTGFSTCSTWSLTNTGGNNWGLTLKNDHLTGRKFGDIMVFYSGGPVTVSNVSSPTGWDVGNPDNHNGLIWFDGNELKMDNFTFAGGKDDKFLDAGETVSITFTLTGGTPVGVGVHAQEGPGNPSSQWIRFDPDAPCTNGGCTSVVPEPSTYALMASGLLGIVGFSRRRRRNNA